MNRMDYVDLVKPGDTVRIVPIDKVPNADREFKVDELLNEGFLYGLSTTSDGYVMPYSWIKRLKVIKHGKDVSSCKRFTKYPSNYVKADANYPYSRNDVLFEVCHTNRDGSRVTGQLYTADAVSNRIMDILSWGGTDITVTEKQ